MQNIMDKTPQKSLGLYKYIMNEVDTLNIEKMKQGTMKSFLGNVFVRMNEVSLTPELMHTPASAFLQFFGWWWRTSMFLRRHIHGS